MIDAHFQYITTSKLTLYDLVTLAEAAIFFGRLLAHIVREIWH